MASTFAPSDNDNASAIKILIVDDEPELAEAVAWRLEQQGFEVGVASDAQWALMAAERDRPDVVLLDLVLPSMSGLDVFRELRRIDGSIAVIFVSGRSEEADRVAALEIGADDFVVKPFSPRELVARIRLAIRRSRAEAAGAVSVHDLGDLQIDPVSRQVLVRGQEIHLPIKEFDLLLHMAQAPDRLFTRAELIEAVWPDTAASKPEATLTEHISRLRRKLENDPSTPQRLTTVRGLGYRLRAG